MVRARAKGTLPFRILSAVVALTFVMSMATVGYSIPPVSVAPDPSQVQTVTTDASDGPSTPAAVTQPEADAPSAVLTPPALSPKSGTATIAGGPASAPDPVQAAAVSYSPASFQKTGWEAWVTSPHPGWGKENLGKEYREGDWIPVRILIDNTSNASTVTVPSFVTQFDFFDSTKNAVGLDDFGSFYYYNTPDQTKPSGDHPHASAAVGISSYFTADEPDGMAKIKLSFATPADKTELLVAPGTWGVLYFQVHIALSPEWLARDGRSGAKNYPGASAQGYWLSWNGDGVGSNTISLPCGPDVLPKGAVSGVKYNDLDRDKTRDANEPPLSGWKIVLTYTDPLDSSHSFVESMTTGADGAFSFTSLPSGDFQLTEILSGHSGWRNSTVIPLAFTLGLDQVVTGKNIGNYQLTTPDVSVTKTPSVLAVPETGGSVTFTYVVTNNNATDSITITSVSDDKFALDGAVAVPFTLAPKGTKTFTLTKALVGEAGTTHENTVTVVGTDAEGQTDSANAHAVVRFTDVAPTIRVEKLVTPTTLPEPGGTFFYTIRVTNTSQESVTLDSLTDLLPGGMVLSAPAGAIGTVLAPNASYTWSPEQIYTEWGTYLNVASATAHDNEGTSVSASATQTVSVTDGLPNISITKTPSVDSVPETGGNVTYTIVVTNNSVESVQITALSDDRFGNLAAEAGGLPFTLAAMGGSKSFTITRHIEGNAGTSHVNLVTAVGHDNENNTVNASDDATVAFTDVMPDISVTKTPSVDTLPETGGNVTYTFVVKNNSAEAVRITSVADDRFGNLNVAAGVPFTLAGNGGSTTFTITRPIAGEAGTSHTNVVTVRGEDGDGNADTATDDASVTFTDVLPTVKIEKHVTPSSLPEPGGLFSYTILVTNTSPEPIVIDALTDTLFDGTVLPNGAAAGVVLQPGGTYEWKPGFTYTEVGTYADTARVTAHDNERNSVSDSASASVLVDDVLPDITVIKTANPTSVPETGGDVEFTYVIHNNAPEAVTITSMVDDTFDLTGALTLPLTIPANGSSAPFKITRHLVGDFPGAHVNVVTVMGHDNENHFDTATDDATVAFTDVKPDISVTKTPNVSSAPETGGDVVYTFVVTNNSLEDVEIGSVVDNKFGDLTSEAGVPFSLAHDESKTFSITRPIAGPANTSHVNVVTVTGHDNDGNSDTAIDDATVRFADVVPTIDVQKIVAPGSLPEPGGTFHYTITVRNTSSVPVTITSLTDLLPGGVVAAAPAGAIGTVLGPNEVYSWTPDHIYTEAGTYTNVASATAVDADGNIASDFATQVVDVTNVDPDISITKTPGVDSVPETGGNVTYTFVVTNNSVESVQITSVTDDKFGDLGTVAGVPFPLAADGGSKTFTVTKPLSGEAGTSHVNVVTAVGRDNEGNTDTATARATVSFTDVLPDISVSKTPNVTSVPETGGDVSYEIAVTNHSLESVNISSVVDDRFGDLSSAAGVPFSLAHDESKTFTITRPIAGEANTSHINVVTVTGSDNDGNSDSASDDATVAFTDVLPTVKIEKTATPLSLAEPGGLFSYTIVVTNTAPEAITIDALTDTLPDATVLTRGEAAGMVLQPGQTYEWKPGFTYTEADSYLDTVRVTAHDNELNSVSAAASATVVVTDVLPDISVSKTPDKAVILSGESVTFSFVVTNNSVEPVTVNSVTDSVFGDLAVDAGVPFVLGVGQTKAFSITRPVSGTGSHVNTVTVTAQDNEQNIDTATDDATVRIVRPAIEVIKTSDAPELGVAEGSTVAYTYQVTNTGDVPLTNVDVVDDKLGDIALDVTLGVGESKTFTKSTQIFADTINVATASGQDELGHTVSDTDDAEVITFAPFTPPNLEIMKDADPVDALPGEVVTYTLRYRNIGEGDAQGITIVDDYDEAHMTVVDAGGGKAKNGKITWHVFDEVGLSNTDGWQTLTYSLKVSEDMPAKITHIDNVVVITVDGDSDPSNNTDNARVTVGFLPFTGGAFPDPTAALIAAFGAVALLVGLRKTRREDED